MALPPQAIEKLIREPSSSQGTYRQLTLFSGALLGITVVIYAGLRFGYQAYLNNRLATINTQIKDYSTSISQEDRTQIQAFYSQLVNLKTLLGNHTMATPVLMLLERTVQPNVYYTKLTVNAATNQVVLAGAAKSLDDAAAQAAALQTQPEVDHLDFNNAGAQAAGPWQFTLTLYLRPSVLRGAVASSTAPQPAAPVTAPANGTSTTVVVTSTPR